MVSEDQTTDKEGFTIRKLTASDVDTLVSIIKENLDSFEEAGSVLAATYRRLNQFWAVYSAKGAGYWLVTCKDSNEIAGGAGLGPFAGLSPSEKIGEIRELVISKEFRGRGAGKLILKHILDHAFELGYQRVYLETTPQMQMAQKLFTNFGFKPVAIEENTQDDQETPLPCYFMLDRGQEA